MTKAQAQWNTRQEIAASGKAANGTQLDILTDLAIKGVTVLSTPNDIADAQILQAKGLVLLNWNGNRTVTVTAK